MSVRTNEMTTFNLLFSGLNDLQNDEPWLFKFTRILVKNHFTRRRTASDLKTKRAISIEAQPLVSNTYKTTLIPLLLGDRILSSLSLQFTSWAILASRFFHQSAIADLVDTISVLILRFHDVHLKYSPLPPRHRLGPYPPYCHHQQA